MSSMLNKARQVQAEKRAKNHERDPADLGNLEEPDWDACHQPEAPEEPEESSSETHSASGNAGGWAGENASDPASEEAPASPAPAPGRRRGRPRGPDRAKLSVRILADNDAKLTAAVEKTGQSPQYLVDEALQLLFKRLGIKQEKAG